MSLYFPVFHTRRTEIIPDNRPQTDMMPCARCELDLKRIRRTTVRSSITFNWNAEAHRKSSSHHNSAKIECTRDDRFDGRTDCIDVSLAAPNGESGKPVVTPPVVGDGLPSDPNP